MRFDAVAASALLLGAVNAQDAQAPLESKTEGAPKPTFTPTTLKAPFLEQFTDDWTSRWTPSHAKKEDSKSDEDWAYVGEWSVEEPTVFPGMEGDKSLVVKNAAAHHAISAKFPTKIDNKGKTLVLQYEVKPQNGLECGGAYMKLLQDNKKLNAEEFSNTSPYVIMFGPDKCGTTNKVHFIFKHKNPKTGEYEEKHLNSPPAAKTSKLTSLYTLIVKPDNTFEMLIDNKSAKNGSLLEDFSPSVNPAKELDDPKDTKPADWVDEARIPDPESTKPADWDEDQPFEIVDAEATKPDGWLENEPTSVPDPEAEKPEDWDEEEDGDWVPPSVLNPKCEEASGCGKWEPPMIKNPEYKGKWTAPFIDNPLYKGVWTPRKIANPNYFEDKKPANFEPMSGIGFEIWSMQSDISFDNIYIGHSIDDAKALAAETFVPKRAFEDSQDKPKPESKPKSPSDLVFMDDPMVYMTEKWELFLTIAKRDPMEAIRFVPEVAGALGGLIVLIIAFVAGAITLSNPAAPTKEDMKKAAQKAKDSALNAKDQAVDAAASGVDTVKTEANKRTTRSVAATE